MFGGFYFTDHFVSKGLIVMHVVRVESMIPLLDKAFDSVSNPGRFVWVDSNGFHWEEMMVCRGNC